MNWIREKRTLANKSEDGILSRKKAKCEDRFGNDSEQVKHTGLVDMELPWPWIICDEFDYSFDVIHQ